MVHRWVKISVVDNGGFLLTTSEGAVKSFGSSPEVVREVQEFLSSREFLEGRGKPVGNNTGENTSKHE
jgi:hypothetical protein